MKRKDVVLFLGLLPVSYIGLLILGAGDTRTSIGDYHESDGSRLIQSIMLSLAISVLVWYFRKDNVTNTNSLDPARQAMRFFGKARDAYRAAGLNEEAVDCDLLIGKISHIALDPRIELKDK